MKLSTKARYAVRAMIELSREYGKGPLQLKMIAKRQDISDKYLEQVLSPLRVNGLIFTQKGSRGGYVLSRAPEEITLYDVVHIVEGSLAPVDCVDNNEICSRRDLCVTRDVWSKLKEVIIRELESVNLAELAAKQSERYSEVLFLE
ncbi:MAG: Rrf2 family transcriptional regulator [Bacillota bacterium]|nr:Rrf2 family transcriptional regulator [Bacillota bacterium]